MFKQSLLTASRDFTQHNGAFHLLRVSIADSKLPVDVIGKIVRLYVPALWLMKDILWR